ncbi:MAG: SpoIIE family protein phosphatase [Phycisphaerales bacterium]|nr:SpoIIE family protein phosphatase [Phycisphaerales bacterium]
MLREKIDIASLEDFVCGLAVATKLRVSAHDSAGHLITMSPPASAFAQLSEHTLQTLPQPLDLVPVQARQPPASVAFLETGGAWHIVAPVPMHDRPAGYVAIGEFRDPKATLPPPPPHGDLHVDADQWFHAWQRLPALERGGQTHGVATARWAARILSDWLRRENQLGLAAEEFSLLGDIGELIAGAKDLQKMLDRIVAETARVMRCRYASLRLYEPETDELRIAAAYNMSTQYVGYGVISRKKNAVDDEALRGEIVYIEDAQTDPRIQFPENARKLGIVSGLVVGMMYRGRPVGVLRIYSDYRRKFRTTHRHLLRAVASQAAIAIVNARLVEERLRSAELERQLALAGDLQARMSRNRPPLHKYVETAVVFDPSSHVGGDFCDLFPLRDGRLGVVVGDVVGHGVAAALLSASIRGALRSYAETVESLAEIMTRLNHHVIRETQPAEFVTILLAAISRDGRTMTCCNAGHEPPLILRHDRIMAPDDASLVLGVSPDETYTAHDIRLEPDDFVLLYTDGAIEAMDFHENLFGRERLLTSLRLHGVMSPEPALRNIHWDIRRFVGMADQSDDLTMVGVRVRSETP